jgi:CBS domain containing-hemolysin-like protein
MAQEPGSTGLRRALRVGSAVFIMAAAISFLSNQAMSRLHVLLAFAILVVLVLIGVFFDVIGTAVTAAEEKPFHAMAAKKLGGATQALWLVRHADRVANFCNDIVGDIAGTISGAAGATIAVQVARMIDLPEANLVTGLIVVGFVTGLTVGGKAGGKTIAVRYANDVVLRVGRLLYGLEMLIGRPLFPNGRRPRSPERRRTT